MSEQPLDCLVIGGGPAGLTAAIYLARFHLRVAVADRGNGRALSIPRTHNHAGFPGGIRGPELVARMAAQAREFGADLLTGEVTGLARLDAGFDATTTIGRFRARAILLATGVTNHRPSMPDALHDAAVSQNLLRYCPVCDGYEVTDQQVGVLGTGSHGAREALFLRGFTRDVTLIAPDGQHGLTASERSSLADAAVKLIDGPVNHYTIAKDRIGAATLAGLLEFEAIYPALGSTMHSALARSVGAAVSDAGCITVDAHQRTSLPGLYAAGDVVLGLDQISHAMGQAGVAATAIRNDLAARSPLYR